MPCVSRCANTRAGPRNPVPGSLTVKRSRPQKKGLCGYDAGKKIKGRKRHILVDTLAPLLMVVVHVGNLQDRDGALSVLARAQDNFPTLRLIWADGGYAGQLL